MSFNTPLRLNAWEGELVSCLPWLEETRSFITAMASGDAFRVNYFMKGVRIGGFEAVPNPSDENARLSEELEWLSRAQVVAEHHGLFAKLPRLSEITRKTQDDIEALWGLITGNTVEHSIAGVRFSIQAKPDVRVGNEGQSPVLPVRGDMKMIGTATFDFFGQLIEVPDTEQLFTRMKLVDTKSDSISRQLTFEGQDDSTLSRRKVA